jgi:putative methyltransferase (TIGR04325 family)
MNIIERLHQGIDRLADLPPLITLRRQRFNRLFESAPGHNLFRGVYASFDAALAACPPSKPAGYDNPEAAALYADRRLRIFSTDYPPMFWLYKCIVGDHCREVLDIGGHVGVTYYAYAKYIGYPANLCWTVFDVPAVIRRGRELAAHEDSRQQLRFADSLANEVADVALAYGSLQYMAGHASDILSQMKRRPKHVLINMLPVHPQFSYFTVQDIGAAFCPYQIFSEAQLMNDFHRIGYRLVDRWENLEKRCTIQFAPEYSLDRYFGYYFVAEAQLWH